MLRAASGCLLVSALVACLPVGGQQLTGPTSGLIYDRVSRSIRPILGFPGAAYLGPALFADLDYASVAPDGKQAVAVQAGQVILIRELTSTQPLAVPLDGAMTNLGRVLWASDSTAAVLCAVDAARVQRIRSLRDTPLIEDPIDLPASEGGLLTVAADSSARRVVVGIHDGNGGGLYLISEYGDVSLLQPMNDPSAVAFSLNGEDVYASDRASTQIFVFYGVAPGAAATMILSADDGVSDPIGLANTIDRLYLVSGTGKSVRIYGLPSHTFIAEVPLEQQPQGIGSIPRSPYYALTEPRESGDLLLLFDVRTEPSVFFVPAGGN